MVEPVKRGRLRAGLIGGYISDQITPFAKISCETKKVENTNLPQPGLGTSRMPYLTCDLVPPACQHAPDDS